MKQSKIQNFLSLPQLLIVNYFHKKLHIDVPLSSKYASDKIPFNSYSLTLKSMLSFKLLCFDYLLKETLTLLTMLVVKTIHCKTENDIRKYNH